MRLQYGEDHIKNKLLAEHEMRTMDRLEKIKDKMIKKSRQSEKAKAVKVNPFLTMMFRNMSYHTWVKVYSKI